MRVLASPFDSNHYELKIGRLVPDSNSDNKLISAIASARAANYDLLVVRLPTDDPRHAILERDGHRSMDTLVTSTLERPSNINDARHPSVAICRVDCLDDPADISAVEAITAESISGTHLHLDGRLPLVRTRQLYAAWGRNDVTGRAQHTFVARAGAKLVGYIAVLETAAGSAIDLVAVAPSWQGKGVGSAMLAMFTGWIARREGVTTVGTQADNPALALYARFGFKPTRTELTYHLWLT